MNDLIARLDTWLAQARPDYYARLGKPSTPAEFDALEATLGQALPASFKLLYGWRNGQDSFEALDDRHQLMTLSEIDWQWTVNKTDLLPLAYREWWNPSWVPFLADIESNLLCVDLAGSFGGQPGQIVEFIHDDPSRVVRYPSLEAWLSTIVTSLERKMWRHSKGTNGGELSVLDHDGWESFVTQNNPGFPRVAHAVVNDAKTG